MSAAPSLDSALSPDLSPPRAGDGREGLRDVVALAKPGITLSSVIVAAGTFALAVPVVDADAVVRGLVGALGTALIVMAAGAFNMVLERDVDQRMARTKDRPVAAGRMSPFVASALGALWALSSLPLLAWARPTSTPPLALALGVFSLFLYVLVYTPMKQTSVWALVVGAVPGAMPALMGGTLATGKVDVVGVGLFAIVFLWQLPHFLAISLYREREYTDAGHRVFAQRWGVPATKAAIVASVAVTVGVSVGLVGVGVGGGVYAAVAVAVGVWWFSVAARAVPALVRKRATPRVDDNAWARRVFFVSLGWQTILFAGFALDRVVRLLGL